MSVKWFEELKSLGLEEVLPLDFYRDVFPEGSLQEKASLDENGNYNYDDVKGKYCGIAIEITNKIRNGKPIIYRYSITDELDTIKELLKSENFVLLSPISYVGKTRATENTRLMYAFALEIDNLRVDKDGNPVGLKDLLHQMRENILPQANYIVTSGNGVHLYFLLDTPIRLFENVRQSLTRYKKFITRQFWNSYITFDSEEDKIQYESAFQGFRLVGGVTKNGERTHVFRLSSHPITIEYLNEFVYQEKNVPDPKIEICYESNLTLKEAAEKYPEWYQKRIIEKQKKGSWIVKEDLYKWWFNRIKKEIKVGHRYHALMLLSIYAIKCGISYEDLEKDCFSLLEPYDNLSESEENRFEASDVMSALQVFQDKDYVTFPINSIEKLSGLKIEKNKRNGRKQEQHLFLARRRKEDLKLLGEKINEGRPKGSGEKKDIVCEWRIRNPYKKKIECYKSEKLSRTTIDKWWNFLDENTDYIEAVYCSLSLIPFSVKRNLFRKMKMRYDFNEKFSEKDIKIKSEIDFIHELYKLTGVCSYERARIYYIIRDKDNKEKRKKIKEFKELKKLIKNQAIYLKDYVFFCVLVDGAKTEEDLKRLCLEYDFLPNLELF